MKIYKLCVFFLFVFFVINISKAYSMNFSLLGKTFVIDVGHGGKDPGAIYFNKKEAEINLTVSKNLKIKLEKKGAICFLTRNSNYDLSSIKNNRRKRSDFDNRLAVINSINPDLVISIHMNAENTGQYKGLQVFYNKENSRKLAESITKSTKTNRKPKKIKNVYLMDNIKHKSILIEYAFISNYSDLKSIQDNENVSKLNKSIIKGIEKELK